MDLSLRCDSECWATARVEPSIDRHGNDVAVVVAKMAYAVSQRGEVRIAFRPVRWSEVPDGRGGVRFPSELCDERPGTDAALVGTAFPPGGKAVNHFLAWLAISGNKVALRKSVNVFGPRTFVAGNQGVVAGPAGIAVPTPLVPANAFGGSEHHDQPERFAEEEHNPVGRGFSRTPASLIGTDAHRLEVVPDPALPSQPHLAHGFFAPIPANWAPRRNLIGTHDESWAKTRAPVRPKNFDVRHNSWALPGLHSEVPLLGDEAFEVGGVRKEGIWRFSLPRYRPIFESRIGSTVQVHKTHLDSILVDADDGIVELSWRAAVLLPDPWERLTRLRVWSEDTLPADVLQESTPNPKSA